MKSKDTDFDDYVPREENISLVEINNGKLEIYFQKDGHKDYVSFPLHKIKKIIQEYELRA